MRSQSAQPYFMTESMPQNHVSTREKRVNSKTRGLISEVLYSDEDFRLTQLILLPLLQQLAQQARWQLWLTPGQKLSREWVLMSGLPVEKMMQATLFNPVLTINAMEKALQTGNYSVIISWLSEELTNEQHLRLLNAAEMSNTIVFMMRPVNNQKSAYRPRPGLKIHSNLYH